MYILYLDESGAINNAHEEYYVLGGIAVFEAQIEFLIKSLDKLAMDFSSNPYDIEFHASEIFSRRVSPWNKLSKEEAQGVIKAVLKIVRESYDTANIFSCAIHKKSFPGENVVEAAFEDVFSRFDRFLENINAGGNRNRGLLVLDQNSYENTLHNLSNTFKKKGTRWTGIKHITDIPHFVDSKLSRLIQAADHIAYSIFRYYNANDANYFNIIYDKIYCTDNILHGLSHKQKLNINCPCPACLTRRVSSK